MLIYIGVVQVFAHSALLDVVYDDCIAEKDGDGIDEIWYDLEYFGSNSHISNEEDTIKYYFEETSQNGMYTWTTDVSESVANEIKNAYANSMKKWNNVYYYSYDENGGVTKHKIINIVEGTASDHNLSIYPAKTSNSYAETDVVGDGNIACDNDDNFKEMYHKHFVQWKMTVYVDYFYVNGSNSAQEVELLRDRTGAHEIGHVLGLDDVDKGCYVYNEYHHNELLMGFGTHLENRCCDITYKDIAGVAITRGFHTDNDHRWLNWGVQSNGKYKLSCTICNGVKYVSSLSGYTYNTFGACNNNHALSGGNMMAVASYGTKDYYKCKYCRYVAPFSLNVYQNYTIAYHTDALHKVTNTVSGLGYVFYEKHTFVNNQCTECGFSHTHSYSPYLYYNNREHKKNCSCGLYMTEAHYIRQSDIVDNRYVKCLGCRAQLDLFNDYASSVMSNIAQVSINGSYILPSGIVVLVDEDIQAYIDGTLVFYHPDNIPSTQ